MSSNNYNIDVIKTGVLFKATYKNGKFKQIAHVRGPINEVLLSKIGKMVPLLETHLNAFENQFKNHLKYTVIQQQKSLYAQFVNAWHSFYESFTNLPPKFTGADGNALKSIIEFLKKLEGNDEAALSLWQLLLDKWTTLKDFHQQNTDLKYINSKLNIILYELKHQGNTATSNANGSVQL